MKMPPSLSYGALLALELGYTFLVFDPGSTNVQAGLMLIVALEVAFAVRVAKVQLYLKQVDRPLLMRSRSLAVVYAVGLLTALFSGMQWVMAVAFIAVASAKLVWEHYFGRYVASPPASTH